MVEARPVAGSRCRFWHSRWRWRRWCGGGLLLVASSVTSGGEILRRITLSLPSTTPSQTNEAAQTLETRTHKTRAHQTDCERVASA